MNDLGSCYDADAVLLGLGLGGGPRFYPCTKAPDDVHIAGLRNHT